MKQVQAFKDNKESRRVKHGTCYTSHEKGHLGKDYPKGNLPKSNLVHYDFSKLRKDKAGTYVVRVIDSPQTNLSAIWIPRHLVTSLHRPNKIWVPRISCCVITVKEQPSIKPQL